MGIFCQETYLNRTENHGIGESDVYETFAETPGELYRAMVAEYGRCIGRVYVDSADGPKAIGWVFVKRMRYEDSPETYLREVWVTLHERMPETQTTVHYQELSK